MCGCCVHREDQAVALPDSPSPSRRSILVGAIGAGLAALGATLGVPRDARAADGDAVHVGGEYTSSSLTAITNSTNNENVLYGHSTGNGAGVVGNSGGYFGVVGN